MGYVAILVSESFGVLQLEILFVLPQKWATTLRELLESAYIIDYIDSNSTSEAKPKSRGSGVTWTTLFRSVVVHVTKEAEGIAKLEDKGAQSSSAYTSRQTKKKVHELWRSERLLIGLDKMTILACNSCIVFWMLCSL